MQSIIDIVEAMSLKKSVTKPKLQIPLRTVKGDVNPKYLIAEMMKEVPLGLPTQAYQERRDNKLKARIHLLIDEEERVIDEFCGLSETTPPDNRTWEPQYEPFIPRYYIDGARWQLTQPLYTHGPRMPTFPEDM